MAFRDLSSQRALRVSDPERREADGRWKKGIAPNPGGRPRDPFRLWEKAQKLGPECIRFYIAVLHGKYDACTPAPTFRDKLSVVKELLDRGFGKPKQSFSIEHNAGDGPVTFTLAIGEPKQRARDWEAEVAKIEDDGERKQDESVT